MSPSIIHASMHAYRSDGQCRRGEESRRHPRVQCMVRSKESQRPGHVYACMRFLLESIHWHAYHVHGFKSLLAHGEGVLM